MAAERLSVEKSTKETLKALAMGWEVEKKIVDSRNGSLKGALGYYLVRGGHRTAIRLKGGINKISL